MTSSVSEGVDADDTIVAFTPRVPPHMQPFANASGESSTGRTASRVLSPGMLFLSNYGVSYNEGKVRFRGPTNDSAAIGKRQWSRKIIIP